MYFPGIVAECQFVRLASSSHISSLSEGRSGEIFVSAF